MKISTWEMRRKQPIAVLLLLFGLLLGLRLLAVPEARQLPFPPRSVGEAAGESSIPLPPGQISVSELRGWLHSAESVLLIDARARADFETDHLPQALHLDPHADLSAQVFALVQSGALEGVIHLVVYCDDASCGASETVADHLREQLGTLLETQGTDISVLHGGFATWRADAQETSR